MPQRLRKIFLFNIKWHRRIGLGITIMLVFLAATGILLNHSPALNLANKHLKAPWLLNWYGLEHPQLEGVRVGDQWLSLSDNSLFLDTAPVATCPAPLHGAAGMPDMLLALCEDALLLLTPSGELIEKVDTFSGLPEGITRLQALNNQILISNAQQTYVIDPENLSIMVRANIEDGWSTPTAVPDALFKQIDSSGVLPGISLESLILDLHSGRFFGTAGVWFVDIIGILLCALALTGIWAWNSRRRLNGGGK